MPPIRRTFFARLIEADRAEMLEVGREWPPTKVGDSGFEHVGHVSPVLLTITPQVEQNNIRIPWLS
jgi:hypothetical protein